jgi:hypothetical protein
MHSLPLLVLPTACRQVVCDIGGARELSETVERAGKTILARRRHRGVLAFGSDDDVRSTLGAFAIHAFEVHTIHARLLPYEPAERELVHDALARALARELPLIGQPHTRGHTLACDVSRAADGCFDALRSAIGAVGGTIAGTQIVWSEAIRLKLWCDGEQACAVFEPTLWLEPSGAEMCSAASRFVHERLGRRSRRQHFLMLDAWARLLTGGRTRELRAFGTAHGIDATFTIGR